MARKKRQPGGRPPRRARPKQLPPEQPPLPDRRVLEGSLYQFGRSQQGDDAPDTPLSRAQEVMYQAFGERDPRRRVQLARDALALCPDCADAYVLLAEHESSRKAALALYEQGVAAGERALGPETFDSQAGHFWGVLETRPYMRARLGLALELWTTNRREEAVPHLQEMLRLNPNDNQGVRYTLAGFLLFLDRDADLARLLDQYDEESATWLYTRALLAFRQQGDTAQTRVLLEEAKKANRHIPDYLIGRKYPRAEQPDSYAHGSEEEALIYVQSFLAGWKFTPGAVAWMRANDDKRKSKTPQPKGPLGFIKKWVLDHLEQTDDVWQADFRQTPRWLPNDGHPIRPWLGLVISRSNELVLGHAVIEEAPTPALLWDSLLQSMQHPAIGEPHRPTELQVPPDERWEALRGHLDEVGITLTVAEELDPLDGMFEDMSEHVGGPAEPGLLDSPGVGPEQAAGFYDAAASFFLRMPWRKTGYESAIKVECDKFSGGPWYGVLMGQSGLTAGLALYDDFETLRYLWSSRSDNETSARETQALSVTFGEEWTIPVADLDAIGQHGWKVARPDAYPDLGRKERGMSTRLPLAWEVELMEACLRAVPEFVDRRQQDDPTKEEMTVPTASGELKLALSWVVEDGS
jgi:tetratricopeptide (TPR) repeat protein